MGCGALSRSESSKLPAPLETVLPETPAPSKDSATKAVINEASTILPESCEEIKTEVVTHEAPATALCKEIETEVVTSEAPATASRKEIEAEAVTHEPLAKTPFKEIQTEAVAHKARETGLEATACLAEGEAAVDAEGASELNDRPAPVLLPPPAPVRRLLASSESEPDFEYGSAEHGELVRAVVPWLIDALAEAHDNEEVQRFARRLLATANFSLQLSVENAWEPLMTGVKIRLQELGRPLQTHSQNLSPKLNSESLSVQLTPVRAGDPDGLQQGLSGQARLDCLGFLSLPAWDWDDPVAMQEQVWIHVLRLIALAINERFGVEVRQRLAGIAEISVAPIKGFTRMRNKMQAKDDHRFARRPRPSRNVDINRCLAVVEDASGMQTLCDRCTKDFGVVKIKNGFDLSAEEAASVFELRVVMLTLRYDAGISYGELAGDRQVQKLWSAYVDGDPEKGIPHSRWKSHAQKAVHWLASPSIACLSVVTMVEVQALLRPYYEVRQHMHELYKAFRAENVSQLHADFLRSLPKKPQRPWPEAENILEAAEWRQPEAALRFAAEDPESLDRRDAQGYTPLLIAAEHGFADVAKVLIDAGATSIDAPSAEGDNTPLLWCAHLGYADVAQLLVDADASLDSTDGNGMTPLLWCAQEGWSDVAQVLVTAGAASLDTPTDDGNTPLLWCAQEGFTDVAQVLIQGGARSLDEPRNDGFTPLLLSADNGFQDLVMVLANGGAKIEAAIQLADNFNLETASKLLQQVRDDLKSGRHWLT